MKYVLFPRELIERILREDVNSFAPSTLEELQKTIMKSPNMELTKDLRFILGRPSYECMSTAQVLRYMGFEIAEHAEDEQATSIFWMLNHYINDPKNWRQNSLEEFTQVALLNKRDH
ncbi:hypothetical protein M2401_001023 [Pseudomonas sp. JUb42]|jgi:hypothetical protein|uniref:hypothetical protein n=1 Tax=Pseudomonas sp. JUb42 TaxID=2940611 RepID=UPI00216933F6|nr:hypothetical protein [Pseudomonas sp. JUb42]MCS3467302.1 hypothetical protein [Pseudomonas sp. JUb42]